MSLLASEEKRQAALSSLLAAIGLTAFKLIVGWITHSLGILAEAAHSALDLAAAGITLFAVKAADHPPDREHPFGHGKIENLSALFETLLLLFTALWIIYEAIQRLFFKHVEVEPSVWGFMVMLVSIAVDYSRSRLLQRTAQKYNSQALEADALHFRTDIWSSSVVILGLIGVTLAKYFPALSWMAQADAIAAMIVALIVIYVSGELGLRTLYALIDTAPAGVAERIIHAVETMEGIEDCHAVRIRPSGAHWFVDLHITMNGEANLREVHAMTERVEQRVQSILPHSDVTVHVEPEEMKGT
ncbi:MAG: cation diffusion facilitator family transporter [Anaerolineales bacterium]